MSLNEQSVLDALKVIKDPDLHQDIVSLGFIKNMKIDSGKVSFEIELTTPACPVKDLFKAQAAEEVKKIPGVTQVDVTMTSNVRQAPTGVKNLNMPTVKNIIAVASGKGGVGKSTVAANLALALAKTGAAVGLMDADVYGPSIPRMLGVPSQQPATDPLSKKMIPFEKHGIKFISVGMLQQESDTALIWRGPMASKLVQQFLGGVEWGALDYLLIDLPPGTGDIQLTLTQSVPLAGAIIVTTPQDVARTITQKGLRMFQQVQVPIIGIVENMSGFVCEHCHETTYIFKKGGGKKMSEELVVPFLGEVPLEPVIAADGDYGVPTVAAHPESLAGKAYEMMAKQMASQLSIINNATSKVSNRPKEVNTKDAHVTVITWDDGSVMRYPNRYLRSMCPCAQCVNEVTGERTIKLDTVDPEVRIMGVAPVGRYALHFQWSDGHGTGLYSFDTLHKLGE
ncbi:MAG TPA: P-loop NTPase [bacterium]|nr:P-loop NTPase [bacterium]